SFGIAGGTTKTHEAKWTVQSGAIHGQDGPGGLENGTTVEDAIVHISAAVKGEVRPDNLTSIALRNVPGQLQGGYSVGIGLYSGTIDPLVKHAPLPPSGAVDETIVIAGRTLAIWNSGTLVTVYTDTRAESGSTGQGAKTSSGALTILLPNSAEQVDLHKVAIAALSKNYGVAAHAPPTPPPAALPTPTPAAPPPASVAETALLQQQQASAKKDADDKASKQRTAGLMREALSTTDPHQQMEDYSQVVQIDPSNAAAVQGYKEAQAKVEAAQSAQQQQTTNEIHQQQDQQTKEQQTNNALVEAQGNFLAGHLSQAGTALSTAERLSPNNPMVRDLRSRISSAQSLRSRLYWLGGGGGVIGCLSLFSLWLHRRRQQRFAVLEIVRGLDTGKTFPLDRDMVRIGAVSQDGGQKNDIVIQDVEHAISRFHCQVGRKNGSLYVTDLKSSNGTRLNGETLAPGSATLLRRGNKITLADSVDLRLGYQRRTKKG
ncbi:MAG TPA: FHA domain-containing protein, partial [Edaphobacter sp.]|nr:FHA domain-containing protein [Edaphobacter sp.]